MTVFFQLWATGWNIWCVVDVADAGVSSHGSAIQEEKRHTYPKCLQNQGFHPFSPDMKTWRPFTFPTQHNSTGSPGRLGPAQVPGLTLLGDPERQGLLAFSRCCLFLSFPGQTHSARGTALQMGSALHLRKLRQNRSDLRVLLSMWRKWIVGVHVGMLLLLSVTWRDFSKVLHHSTTQQQS